MKAIISAFGLVLLALTLSVPASAQGEGGVRITCADGTSFDNGVAFVLFDVEPGFTYQATAIGIDGFDPVLAVLDDAGDGTCNDDNAAAADFRVDLPTTGAVDATSRSAGITFAQASDEAAPVVIVVGGFANQDGAFVLLIDGLAATDNDDPGDVFAVEVSPRMRAADAPLTVYLIGVNRALDPLFYLADGTDADLPPREFDDRLVRCDDAGTRSCFGESTALDGYRVSRSFGRTARADALDAMIQVDDEQLQDEDELLFVLGRATANSGEYIIAVHGVTGPLDAERVTSAEAEADEVEERAEEITAAEAEDSGQEAAAPQSIAEPAADGVRVVCDNGTIFDNGVEFVVNQMRPGFTYTATVIGIDGFDPILAVLGEGDEGLCNDDSRAAAAFSVALPTTGRVNGTSRSAQVRFTQSSGDLADVALVVGGFNNQGGEFVLILEGMAATDADGAGDPFSVRLTPDLLADDVLAVYMLGVDSGVDPLIYLASAELEVAEDAEGDAVRCDDAGNRRACWGDSENLTDSRVSRTNNRYAAGERRDAMLELPLDALRDSTLAEDDLFYLTFVMSRFEGSPEGAYVVAFHTAAGHGR